MVLLPALYQACSSAIISSARGLSLFKIKPQGGDSNENTKHTFMVKKNPLQADMLSCGCFYLDKCLSPRTEYLSSPPLLASMPSESSCLFSCMLLPFYSIPPLLQISSLITEVVNIISDPRLLAPTFCPCISLAVPVLAVL